MDLQLFDQEVNDELWKSIPHAELIAGAAWVDHPTPERPRTPEAHSPAASSDTPARSNEAHAAPTRQEANEPEDRLTVLPFKDLFARSLSIDAAADGHALWRMVADQ